MFVLYHSLQFGYKFLHYIAGFFSLFPLFWNPENSGFSLFRIASGWFCLSVIGCFPYFFLVFSGSLCYSIYNNVYRILYPDLKLKKMHCVTLCFTRYFNQSVKKVRKKSAWYLQNRKKCVPLQPLSRGKDVKNSDMLKQSASVGVTPVRCTEYLTLHSVRERERVSLVIRTAWKNFFEKNFEKIWRFKINRLTLQTLSTTKRK